MHVNGIEYLRYNHIFLNTASPCSLLRSRPLLYSQRKIQSDKKTIQVKLTIRKQTHNSILLKSVRYCYCYCSRINGILRSQSGALLIWRRDEVNRTTLRCYYSTIYIFNNNNNNNNKNNNNEDLFSSSSST